jgi:lipopolysaccharide exporter
MAIENENTKTTSLKAGMYSSFIKGSALFFGIASTMILTRVLSETALGSWAQFLLYTSVIEIIRQSLVRNALITFYHSADKKELPVIYSSAWFINLFITLLSTLILLLLALVVDIETILNSPGLNMMFLAFIPGNILLSVTTYFEWRMAVFPNFKPVFIASFIRQSLSLLLIVLGVFDVYAVTNFSLVIIYNAGILIAVVYIFIAHPHVMKFSEKWSKYWVQKFSGYSKYVFGTNVASAIFRTTDHFLTGYIISAAMVAPLSIAARLTNIIDIPSQVIADVLFPKSAALHAGGNKADIKQLYEKAVGMGLALVVPAAATAILIPSLLLMIIGGAKYVGYTRLLQLSLCVSLFMPFLRQFGTFLDSTGKPWINMRMMILLMVLNICTCFFFISNFGLIGAVYGTLTAHAIVFVLNQIVMYKLFGVQLFAVFQQMMMAYKQIFHLISMKVFPA